MQAMQEQLPVKYGMTVFEVGDGLFNHQTHHRGHVSTLLSQLGVDIEVTDLLFYLPKY